MESVRNKLEEFIESYNYDRSESSDVAILGTSSQLIDTLYSVGFIGLEDPTTGAVLFCHDGALTSISDVSGDKRVALHPCYWRALDVRETSVDTEVLLEIHDDYGTRANPQAADIRARRLGQLVSELPSMPTGQEGAHAYEKWVLRTCQILFAGPLSNFELHPAPDGIQRRDVIATNQAERGFWKRVLDDYHSRQVIFEAKNYRDLALDDYRQALSYSGKQYGSIVIIVNRSDAEGVIPKERGWIKEMWDQHGVLVLALPSSFLVRCLKKVRNPARKDYADRKLSDRLDTFVRSYLSLKHTKQRKPKKKR